MEFINATLKCATTFVVNNLARPILPEGLTLNTSGTALVNDSATALRDSKLQRKAVQHANANAHRSIAALSPCHSGTESNTDNHSLGLPACFERGKDLFLGRVCPPQVFANEIPQALKNNNHQGPGQNITEHKKNRSYPGWPTHPD